MAYKEELVDAPGFRKLIAAISDKHASGRLSVVAGTTSGALLFKNGKLVDARLGHLSGFQAINAVAAMPDARFHFDPTVAVPASSSISASERLVLKQFFGIEAADVNDQPAPVVVDEDDEATVVAANVPGAPTTRTMRYRRRSRAPYLVPVTAIVLVIVAAAAILLVRNRVSEQSSQPVATTSESAAPANSPEAAANETANPPATVPDLNGKWNVVNTVNNTSYQSFQNLRIGFALSINQTGTRFTAEGRKVSENGRSLPQGSRTPIQLQGFIDGDRIEATFSEQGATRRTNGRFVWKLDRAGRALTGTFASSAAKTSGKSTARRVL